MFTKINNAVFSMQHIRILTLFTHGFDRSFYGREVSKLLSVSSRTSAKLLDDLEHKGILTSTYKGRTKLFSLNDSFLTRCYLQLAEYHKRIVFLEARPVLQEIASELSTIVEGMVVFFGSRVKGLEKDDSDLDVLIVGNYDELMVKHCSKKYNIEIDVKNYSKKQILSRKSSDILLKEVIKNHIIIQGIEDFMMVTGDEKD
ncbi:MAG: nucleotidyltransferase domain-containing protein [Nanobdellota archaeon]